MENLKTFGFFLNGETLIKKTKCFNKKQAFEKMKFSYPVNFNIQVIEIK